MFDALVITPVKDSIETTLETIQSVKKSEGNYLYCIYNDFSTEDSTIILTDICTKYGIILVSLDKITSHPSPNYRLILQLAQAKAIKLNLPLIIVESDVLVATTTFKTLLEKSTTLDKIGLVGCVTKDEKSEINYPYTKFRQEKKHLIVTNHSLSFCCTLLSLEFLKSYNYSALPQNKHWYDILISKKSMELGFKNYLLIDTSVLHKPHSSRPWKFLKYKNPFRYYLRKILLGLDKT
jgi:Glycosyl transferase family 2.